MASHLRYPIIVVLFLLAAINIDITNAAIEQVGTINGKIFFADPQEPVQAATAATRCHENNGTLARIESYEEGRLVVQYMFANDVTYFWLDGSDYADEGNWYWASTGQPLNYTNWAPNQPELDRSTNCMFMDLNAWFYTYRCTSPTGDGAYHTRLLCQKLE